MSTSVIEIPISTNLSNEKLEANETITELSTPKLKPRFLSDPRRDCKLWLLTWWPPIVLMALVVSVLTLIIFFFAVLPASVRAMSGRVNFHTTSLKIAYPTSTGFQISGSQRIAKMLFSPTIDSFSAMISDAQDRSLFVLELPALHGVDSTIAPQNVTIIDSDAYEAFAISMITDDEIKLYATGKTTVHVLSRAIDVSMKKTLQFSGLREMNITVDSVSAEGSVLSSQATAQYSKSVISLDAGLTHFRLSYQGAAISDLSGVVQLSPGANVLHTLGSASVTDLATQPAKLASLVSLAKAGQDIPLVIQGIENKQATWANASVRALSRNVTITSAQFFTAVGSLGPNVLTALGL